MIRTYISTKSPISHKYLNHGKIVPTQKCFKFNNMNFIKLYSTSSDVSVKFYEDAFSMRKLIIQDNKNKSGIYRWRNKITNDIYIGQSVDLAKRFIRYFNLSYLKNRETLVISRALIKYGYSNFSLDILEYCAIDNLTEREQYYMDKLNPRYNTLKIAGSSSGHKLSALRSRPSGPEDLVSMDLGRGKETKSKISKALKGVYVGASSENSPLFGRTHTEETKALMSLTRSKLNLGKIHTEETKELMKQKALGRKHTEETLLKMSAIRGYPVNIYEKCDSEEFKLIGSFISIRRAAKFLDISSNSIRLCINSGKIYKDRYKFTGGSS